MQTRNRSPLARKQQARQSVDVSRNPDRLAKSPGEPMTKRKTDNLTPAAERKRQQRARAAAGQVHRVAVYLTEAEMELATNDGQSDAADGMRAALWHRWATT